MKTLKYLIATIFIALVVYSNEAKAGMSDKIKPTDITNMIVKASAYKGKKFDSYEIIKKGDGPVIGSKSFKFTLMPYDCGYYQGGTDKADGAAAGRAGPMPNNA